MGPELSTVIKMVQMQNPSVESMPPESFAKIILTLNDNYAFCGQEALSPLSKMVQQVGDAIISNALQSANGSH
jgi:hypothetical protein